MGKTNQNESNTSVLKTPRERLVAMIAGKEIDYLPSQLDFVPYRLQCLLEELNMTLDEFNEFSGNHVFHIFPLTEACYYSSGSEADEKFIELAIERNLIEPHPDSKYVNDNFGVPWIKNKVGVRYADNPLKGKNLDAINWPSPDVPGIFDHLKDELERQRNEYYIIGLQHLTIHERSYLLIGYENFLSNMLSYPEFIEELMDRIVEFHLGLGKRFIDIGVDAVRTGDDFGTQQALQMSPELWRRLYKPRYAKLWEQYREAGITVMHHSCGHVEPIIPDLIEIGCEMLHPVQPLAMSIEKLAKEYGDKLVFHGGIDTQQLLPYGKPQEVKDAVKHCIDVLGAHGKYLIAPSQEIMNDVPTANIMAMIEAIKEYR